MLQSIEEVGMEEGIDIGMEEGRKEGRKETARNLLLLNVLTDEQIAQATNFSIKEVRRLKQEMESTTKK
jgi:predicted transposase/invertase (TIGR01784 family)